MPAPLPNALSAAPCAPHLAPPPRGVAHESDSDSDDEAASDEEKDLAEEIFSEETVLLLMQ